MAFLEWRRFNFFDKHSNIDGGNIKSALGEAKVRDMSSGNGQLVIGDSQGKIHLMSRNYVVVTFKAYQIDVTHLIQSRNSSKLISVGNDEEGINPLLKVWDLSKQDREGKPTCIRISRCVPQNRAVPVTCLAVCESSNLMAIGHQDGSIILFRGDIGRDKSSKQKVLKGGNQPITGLAFRVQNKKSFLFVATTSNVQLYTLSETDTMTQLESFGCTKRCSVMTEASDSQFMIAKEVKDAKAPEDKAIYCFTTEGRGPCFAVDGTKEFLQWFRSYLVIVAHDIKNSVSHVRPSGTGSNVPGGHTVTVLDIDNKFIVYSAVHAPLVGAVAEWGSLFLLSNDYNLHQLNEKDLQSKLSLLFKKNLYDVAINIAKSNHYDKDSLVEIFRQYGDHLYAKGDLYGAIRQYIKTIGKLEPSYVIRKFLDSQHIEKLTEYLAALHRAGNGVANAQHTTLLLNCYTKLNHIEQLKQFLMTSDSEVDFDVDVAIEVCRQSSSEDALLLAEKHRKHTWYLKIQIEDHGKYLEALQYIGKLSFYEAEANIKRYGKTLLEHVPQETSELLKRLCTDYKPSNMLLPDMNQDIVDRAAPEDFIHFFLDHSQVLVEFLEHILSYPSREKCSTQVYNTLIEHYLYLWSSTSDVTAKSSYEQRIMRLLASDDTPYDKNQALLLCHSHKFSPGLLLIYKDLKMYELILAEHMSHKDYTGVLACCRAYGSQNPDLWLNAFNKVIKDPDVPAHVLSDILNVIERDKLLSPLFMLDALATSSVNVGLLKNYFLNILSSESKKTETEMNLAEKYTKETEKLKTLIQQIQSKPVIFQGSRCSVCNEQLELPSVHFLCQHSFHKHCFQSFSESDKECPACLPKNKHILNVIQSQEPSKTLNEVFHSDLDKSDDPFGVVAEYFGRGVFNRLTLALTDANDKTLNTRGRSKRVLQADLETPQASSSRTKATSNIPKSSSVPTNTKPASTNPFEEEYDESKNPFSSDAYDESLNPFS
ncbi:hypothetical protein M8J77_018648 [Diaphorina citri]|nr:hypothetical protein M8J77_018648 [Diaphorina citri]